MENIERVNIVLYDKVYIEKKNLDNRCLFSLRKNFTYENPKYDFYLKNKFSVRKIPKYIEAFLEDNEWFVVPIGGIDTIVSFLKFYEIPFEIIDKRENGIDIDVNFNNPIINGKPRIIWEDYQNEAFDAMLKANFNIGLLQLPPGAGKTLLAIRYICEIKKNTLIIVHESRLAKQWKSEIQANIIGNYSVEIFSGAEGHTFGDITIVLIQSGYKYYKIYDEYLKFGCVIVDECHHSNAMMFEKLLNNLPSLRKFGLSGTLKRKDKMDFLIPLYLGNKFVDIPDSRTKSRIMDFDVEFINTFCSFVLPIRETKYKKFKLSDIENILMNDEYNENPVDFSKLYEMLTGFGGYDNYKNLSKDDILKIGNSGIHGNRNKIILEWIIKDIKDGHKVLILTNRKAHALYILYYLENLGYKGLCFVSETKNDIDFNSLRDDLDNVENIGSIDFIVATDKIASEGLDITDLSSIHLVIPTTNQYKLKQCVGRVRRYKENKTKVVIRDYVDSEFSENKNNFFNIFGLEKALSLNTEDYFSLSAKLRASYYTSWKKSYYN